MAEAYDFSMFEETEKDESKGLDFSMFDKPEEPAQEVDPEVGFAMDPVVQDVFGQAMTGIQKGFLELGQTVNALAAEAEKVVPLGGLYVDENGLKYDDNAEEEIQLQMKYLREIDEDLPEAKTTAGNIARVIAQAVTGVVLTRKLPSSLAIKNRWLQGMMAGAVTDFAFFDPYEKRVSDLLLESDNPVFNNAVTEWLASDEDDSELEGRMKQMLEGGVIGGTLDVAFKGLRYTKGLLKAKSEQKQAMKLLDKLQPSITEYRKEGLNPKAAFERSLRETGIESDAAFDAALKTGRKLNFTKIIPGHSKIQEVTKKVDKDLLKEDGMMLRLSNKVSQKSEDWLGSLHTSLNNISPELGFRLRKFEYDTATMTHTYLQQASNFTSAIGKLRRVDRALHDRIGIALSNQNYDQAIELARSAKNKKLGTELADNLPKVKKMLQELYEAEVATGSKTGFLPDYFPRSVRDYKRLKNWFGGDIPSELDKHINEIIGKRGRALTSAETADEINKFLRSKNVPKKGIMRTDNQKIRSVETVDDSSYKFYADPAEALTDYIHHATHNIQKRKFFGYGSRIPEDNLNIADSIGNYVHSLREAGEITGDDATKITDLLAARFGGGEKAASRSLQNLKNVFYAVTLNSPTNAVTQLGDLAITGYKHGLFNTMKNVGREVAASITGNHRIHMRDLGLDRISEEFASTTKTAKYLDWMFRKTGFKRIDTLGKNANINAAFDKFSKLSKSKEGVKKIAKKYSAAYTDTEFTQLIDDLQKGRVTDRTKFLAFNELADVQPITLSEMPKVYLENPQYRILYTLRSFTLKQMDILRRDAYQEMKRGNVVKGTQNLARYAFLYTMAGASIDSVKDWMLGREPDFEENIPDNLLKMVGMSSYVYDKAKDENWWNTVVMFLAPPGGVILDPIEKFARDGELAASAKVLPYGNLWYQWYGGGAEKYEEYKRKKERQELRESYGLQ